jgi:hypothetical protein
MKSLQSEAPVLSLPELIDQLQQAAIDLGTHRVRGNDYSKAVAAAAMTKARVAVDVAISEQAAAPLLAELGASLPEHADV